MSKLKDNIITIALVIGIILELIVLGITIFIVPKLAQNNVENLLNAVAPQITDINAGRNNIAVNEYTDPIDGDVISMFGLTFQIAGKATSNMYDVELRKTIVTYTLSDNEINHQLIAVKDVEHDYNKYMTGYLQGTDEANIQTTTDESQLYDPATVDSLYTALEQALSEYGIADSDKIKYYYTYRDQPVILINTPLDAKWYTVITQNDGAIVIQADDPITLTDKMETITRREDVPLYGEKVYSEYERVAIANKRRELAEEAARGTDDKYPDIYMGDITTGTPGSSVSSDIVGSDGTITDFNSEAQKSARTKWLAALKSGNYTDSGEIGVGDSKINLNVKSEESKASQFILPADTSSTITPNNILAGGVNLYDFKPSFEVKSGTNTAVGLSGGSISASNKTGTERPFVLVLTYVDKEYKVLGMSYFDGTTKPLTTDESTNTTGRIITLPSTDFKTPGEVYAIQVKVM